MISRRVASIAGLVFGVACAGDGNPAAVPLFGLGRPVREVIVYTWPFAIQVGDTMTVYADAFDSTGFGTAWQSVRTWALSDSSLATATALGPSKSASLFRGQRPGFLAVRVTIAGVTGQDSLRIIPTLAPLQVSPASLTLRLHDSASVKVRITDLSGFPVRNLVVSWSSTDYLVAATSCCRDSVVVRSPLGGHAGTALLRATVANSVVTLPVTVTAP